MEVHFYMFYQFRGNSTSPVDSLNITPTASYVVLLYVTLNPRVSNPLFPFQPLSLSESPIDVLAHLVALQVLDPALEHRVLPDGHGHVVNLLGEERKHRHWKTESEQYHLQYIRNSKEKQCHRLKLLSLYYIMLKLVQTV